MAGGGLCAGDKTQIALSALKSTQRTSAQVSLPMHHLHDPPVDNWWQRFSEVLKQHGRLRTTILLSSLHRLLQSSDHGGKPGHPTLAACDHATPPGLPHLL